MRYGSLAVIVVLLAVLLPGCAGSPGTGGMERVAAGSDVSFELLPGCIMDAGRIYMVDATSQGTPGGLTLNIMGEDLADLKALYCRLRYDPLKWAFADLNPGTGWGSLSEVLQLAAEREPGVLDIGIVLAHWEQRDGLDGDLDLARVTLVPASGKEALSSRQGAAASEPDVQVGVVTIERPAGVLSWTWHMAGDCDGNSEVNISDMTPVGMYFGPVPYGGVAAPYLDLAETLADSDKNGQVNIADITPIGMHLGETLDGFEVYQASDWWSDYPRPGFSAPSRKAHAVADFSNVVPASAGKRPQFRLVVTEANAGGDVWWVVPRSGAWRGKPSASALEIGVNPARQELKYQMSWDDTNGVLRWQGNLAGDVDFNTEVNISDITPLKGRGFFGQPLTDENDIGQVMCDTLHDGVIDNADLVPITSSALYFGSRTGGYLVFMVLSADEIPAHRFAPPVLTPVADVDSEENRVWGSISGMWPHYEVSLDLPSGAFVWIQPYSFTTDPRTYGAMSEVIQIP
jgi:hypothetical protein